MGEILDTYLTLAQPGESLHKVKGSKHFGYAFNVNNEEEIKERLDEIRKLHHAARHHCYAWKLGLDDNHYRANDDGEPSNSAGKPIYGTILSAEITNVLIVVVRYFGGTKLGVGGLIDAYRSAAKMAIEETTIEERLIYAEVDFTFAYERMGDVMKLLKELDLPVIDPVYEMSCRLKTSIRLRELEAFLAQLEEIESVDVLQPEKDPEGRWIY